MQTTPITLYALRQVLVATVAGQSVAGYTVRPGYSKGLVLSSRREPLSGVVGYSNTCATGDIS